jgi:ring-1,2-phenylacetyl-CoA epoxidase subunit PaaE
MFYGNKSASQTIYKSELDALKSDNFNINYVFSRENTDNSILEGRIDADKIKALNAEFLSGSQIDDVYVCGPEDMIFAVKDFYKSQGMSDSNVHFELFTVPTKAETSEEVIDESKEITSQVTVIVDDEEFEFELSSKGKDILQAAQDNDADVPFSCKGGVCCTCKAKVMEGKAKMDLNYALEPEEVEEGFILTCQAHPLTEKVVVSFDEY